MIILQIIQNLLLAWVLIYSYFKYKLKINIHNLPIVLLCAMGLLILNYFSIKNTLPYILVGLIFNTLVLMFSTFDGAENIKISLPEKIIINVATSLAWPQVIILTVFYFINYKTIVKHESA